MKRSFDFVLASLGLLVLSPVLLTVALLIRWGTSGPVLFKQQRVGRDGRLFNILKFRTMVVDADRRGLQITAAGDPRITGIGRLLRRTKLDELPQLINVIRGDMSLVGARPEVPRYVELWPSEAREIVLSLRPGITDPATIEFRDEEILLSRSADPERTYIDEILPRKVQLYLRYSKERSVLGDIRIILQTLKMLSRS